MDMEGVNHHEERGSKAQRLHTPGHEETSLLPQQHRHALLQATHSRVLPEDIVSYLGPGHGCPQSLARQSYCVAAKVHHGGSIGHHRFGSVRALLDSGQALPSSRVGVAASPDGVGVAGGGFAAVEGSTSAGLSDDNLSDTP